MRFKDITGKKFGRLTAVELTGEKRWGVNLWRCICDCGSQHVCAVNTLNSGSVRSCGCLMLDVVRSASTRHGHYGSPTYKVWGGIIQRCTNPKTKGYERYGGAGIGVCQDWTVFENFLRDMGERPDGMTIDRVNNEEGYSKENCRWTTHREQRMNQSKPTITMDQANAIRAMRADMGWGPKKIADALGVSRGAVSGVIYLGNMA